MSLVHSLLFTGIIFGWPSFSMLLQQDGAFLDERCNAECRRLALPCWPLPCAEDACCGCSVCGAEGACPWPPYQRPPLPLCQLLAPRCNATGVDDLNTACLLEQRTSLAMLYTVASTAFVFFLLPGGVMLDRCGAACTSTVAGVAVSSGFAMVACGADHLLVRIARRTERPHTRAIDRHPEGRIASPAQALAFALVGGGSSLAYSTTLATASLFGQVSIRSTVG